MGKIIPELFREIIQKASIKFQTPAISVAVIEDGEISFSEGFGSRTFGKNEEVTADTSYAIASMSKSTVSTSLAMLQEQKLFGWDDKVTKFLPDFRMADLFAGQEMTVLDLLIHHCGLNSESAGTLWYGSDYSREEVVRRVRYLRPVTSFRSTYAYQNVCYLIAGLIIEKICGMSWDDFVCKYIFSPLEMERSFPNLKALQLSGMDNVATPHTQLNGKLSVIPYRNHDNVGPAASVHSTAADLAHYLQMFLNHGIYREKVILKPESVENLHSMHIVVPPTPAKDLIHPRLFTDFSGYGLGWFIQDYQGKKRVGHSGGVDGMRGRMEIFPALNRGIVILTNSEDRRAYQSILYSAFDMFLESEPIDWINVWENDPEMKQTLTEPERIPNTSPSLPDAAYTGVYEDSAYGEIIVRKEAHGLILQFSHTPAFTANLEHWHFDTFRLIWHDPYIPRGLVTFSLNCEGKVESMHIDQPRLLDVDFTELDVAIRKKPERD